MSSYQETSVAIPLMIEVRRNRQSVTQGTATVIVNGEEVVTFADEIEIMHPGDKFYGPKAGGWASKKPDTDFIKGMLFHPYDDIYKCSKKVKRIIDELCEAGNPGTVFGG